MGIDELLLFLSFPSPVLMVVVTTHAAFFDPAYVVVQYLSNIDFRVLFRG